ncbi:MAG: hypothetical protein A2158_01615 [Chloroflexi bacterium RBG_13_46_14]|nr:MAG: hypothetical protein A2158_01615 [Chloroflexi bacterium RBG_13_46_14]
MSKPFNPYARITEKQFGLQVESAAKLRGFEYFHAWNSKHSSPGFPDYFMIHRETYRVIVCELKSEKGKLTELQKNWLNLFAAAGFDVYLWRPSDLMEILTVLDGKTEGIKVHEISV